MTDQDGQQNQLRRKLLEVIADKNHRTIVVTDFSLIPEGSSGYFSPSGRGVSYIRSLLTREARWIDDLGSVFVPAGQTSFTSTAGPLNDRMLAQAIEEALAPLLANEQDAEDQER